MGLDNLTTCPKCGTPHEINTPHRCESTKGTSVLSKQHGGNHYKTKCIQPWEYIEANSLDFFEGNVIKYTTRYKEKNGVEDLKKAQHYIEYLIERESK